MSCAASYSHILFSAGIIAGGGLLGGTSLWALVKRKAPPGTISFKSSFGTALAASIIGVLCAGTTISYMSSIITPPSPVGAIAIMAAIAIIVMAIFSVKSILSLPGKAPETIAPQLVRRHIFWPSLLLSIFLSLAVVILLGDTAYSSCNDYGPPFAPQH